MSRAPKCPDAPWRLIHFLGEQLDKIRIRNAFADARRAQAARMSTQQAGPSFDRCWGSTPRREDRNATMGR
jgi:hypothetical protein